MGKKTDMEMLKFGVAYAKKCVELENELGIDLWLQDSQFRFGNQSISLETLSHSKDEMEASENIYEVKNDVESLTGNKYLDGLILCEGYVYEALYYYQGYGDTSTYGRNATMKLDKELRSVLGMHGFYMDLSRGGTIQLQCKESFEEEMKTES